jgi:hypothetical protein
VLNIAPRLKARIPLPEPGWFSRGYTLLRDGKIARLEATFDIAGAIRDRRERGMTNVKRLNQELPEHPLEPWPPYPPGIKQRIAVLDQNSITLLSEFEVNEDWAIFDQMPDSSWIVADTRCDVVTSNARIIDINGHTTASLLLGDGIQHLQADKHGRIWVGYFDEGVFGNNGWGVATGPEPIGRFGLNCFDESGRLIWKNPGNEWVPRAGYPTILDCEAMNTADDAVWTCNYRDHQIFRMGFDGKTAIWENEKAGAHIIAAHDDKVVLLGGYGEDKNKGVLLRLDGKNAVPHAEFEIDLGGRYSDIPDLSSARGPNMQFVINDHWLELSVKDVVRELM